MRNTTIFLKMHKHNIENPHIKKLSAIEKIKKAHLKYGSQNHIIFSDLSASKLKLNPPVVNAPFCRGIKKFAPMKNFKEKRFGK